MRDCGFGDMDIGFGRHGHGHHGYGKHHGHGFGKHHGHGHHGHRPFGHHGHGPFGHGHGPFGGHHGHHGPHGHHGFMGHFQEAMGCGPMRQKHHGHRLGGPGGPGCGARHPCGSGPCDRQMRQPCHDRRPDCESDQRTSDEEGPRGGRGHRGHKGHRGPNTCGPPCCQRKFGKGPSNEPQEFLCKGFPWKMRPDVLLFETLKTF